MSNTENVPDIPIIPAMTDTVNMSNLHEECIISPEPNFIQIRTMSCQHLVNEAVSGILPGGSFLTQLCETGISDAEAQDYIDQVMQHCNQLHPAFKEIIILHLAMFNLQKHLISLML